MRDKNENIHLWLLEQNRKRDQARLLADSGSNVTAQPVSILNHQWFNDTQPFRVEVERPTFIETTDLDQLLREKKDLEQESHRLDEQTKDLEMRAREFCERVIREIQKNNRKKQQSINHLRERIKTMESRLGLENAIHESNLTNDKKQQEVNRLRELIGELDSQFEEISLSNGSADCQTKQVNNSNSVLPSEPVQKQQLDVNA